MAWLLNGLYLVLLVVLSPWLALRAWKHGKYRAGWGAKLWGRVPSRESTGPCVWLHAVSLGEVNLLGAVMEELAKRRPDVVCYVTTTTRTGYEAACRRYRHCQVAYAPLDFSWAVAEAVRRIQPDLLLLAELELWPNMVRTVVKRGGKVAIINGRLSPRSFRRYRRWTWFFRRLLRDVSVITAQTDEYAQRFLTLGAMQDRVHVTGSLKFDGARTDRRNPQSLELSRLITRKPQDTVWVCGSTFEPEEPCILRALDLLLPQHPQLRLILVPRHPERFDEVARLLDASPHTWVRRSQLDPAHPTAARIVLVDAMGELNAWWALADVGFVGGSLGKRGGQNMIEPAAYGVPICFGPNTVNFRDVVQALLDEEAAEVIYDERQLAAFVQQCVSDEPLARRQAERARRLVQRNLGATQRTWDFLLPLLPAPSPPNVATGAWRQSA